MTDRGGSAGDPGRGALSPDGEGGPGGGASSTSQRGTRGRVGVVCLAVGVVVAGWAMLAIPARATYGARTTADEPQYLLSALSLGEDRDLWIDDELDDRRYQPFHEVALPVQTEPLDNGHTISPHDPLLPVVLAVPMGLAGWAGAKAMLALLAGALAGLLTWTAHRRLAVPLGAAAGTVLAFGLSAPLSAYATQVYPELPAALAVTVVIAALTGLTGGPPHAQPRLRRLGALPSGDAGDAGRAAHGVTAPHLGRADGTPRVSPGMERRDDEARRRRWRSAAIGLAGGGALSRWWLVGGVVGIVALPWLGVKYSPVAAVLALVLLLRLWRLGHGRTALGVAMALGMAGVAYLVGHRLLYGGWTVYAAGDHFVEGELSVVGTEPNYPGRSRRLVGLLLDREFGLAAWMPGYLLAVPALAALLRAAVPRMAAWRRLPWPFSPPLSGSANPSRNFGSSGVLRAIAAEISLSTSGTGAASLDPGTVVAIVAPLVAGWGTATWVALTMHGWWWPGRQTVVVLPCIVLAVAWWVGQARPARRPGVGGHRSSALRRIRGAWIAIAGTGVVGAVTWLWLVVEARTERLTLIVDFETTGNPLYRAWRELLPDYRHPEGGDWALQAVWLVALGLAALVAASRAGRPPATSGSVPTSAGPAEPDAAADSDAAAGSAVPDASDHPAGPAEPTDPDSHDRRRTTHVPA